MSPARWISLLAVVAAGCTDARFVRTDPSFVAAPKPVRPQLFVDHLPDRPYRAVGVIAVELDASVAPEVVQSAAADLGQKQGCDVLVASSLRAEASPGISRWIVLASAGGERGLDRPLRDPNDRPGGEKASEASAGKTEFICGVFDGAGPQPTAL